MAPARGRAPRRRRRPGPAAWPQLATLIIVAILEPGARRRVTVTRARSRLRVSRHNLPVSVSEMPGTDSDVTGYFTEVASAKFKLSHCDSEACQIDLGLRQAGSDSTVTA